MFSGSIVALVTPMNVDGSVDFHALQALINFHIEQGTDGIVSVGTTGQSATLSHKENIDVIARTVQLANGRIPIIAGTGSNSTAEATEMTQAAKDVGADACLLVAPYYNKPTQEGLYQHYKAIAEAVDIPQVLYNVPGRSVVNIDHDTTIRLSKIDNIVGTKDATGDVAAGKKLIAALDPEFFVVSGDDATTRELISHGAKGCISVTANVAPKLMHEMCAAALAGNTELANRLDQQLADLHSTLFVQSSPIPATYALNRMGYMDNHLRLPMTTLDSAHTSIIDSALAKAGIILN